MDADDCNTLRSVEISCVSSLVSSLLHLSVISMIMCGKWVLKSPYGILGICCSTLFFIFNLCSILLFTHFKVSFNYYLILLTFMCFIYMGCLLYIGRVLWWNWWYKFFHQDLFILFYFINFNWMFEFYDWIILVIGPSYGERKLNLWWIYS